MSHKQLQPYAAQLNQNARDYFSQLLNQIKENHRACDSFYDSSLLQDITECGTTEKGKMFTNFI